MEKPEKPSSSFEFKETHGLAVVANPRGDSPVSNTDCTDPLVGCVLGDRYQIEKLLASGGMGAVYRARHVGLEKSFAIKVLHERLAGDPQLVRRFDREAEVEAQLDHPNCVRVVDAGCTPGGTKYLVMPLLRGAELRELMVGPLGMERTSELIAQVLAGLEHAHRRGFVHRDVKPENVFVVADEDGLEVAKLVDFGLVKPVSPQPGQPVLTEAGRVFGTPWYISPEQAVGEPIDARADLYSVGAMMFEMLSGTPPFHAPSFSSILRMHLMDNPPGLPSEIPAPIAEFVERLLAKNPQHRFATAAQAAQALSQARRSPPRPRRDRHAIPFEPLTASTTALRRPTALLSQAIVGEDKPPSLLSRPRRLGAWGTAFVAAALTITAGVVATHAWTSWMSQLSQRATLAIADPESTPALATAAAVVSDPGGEVEQVDHPPHRPPPVVPAPKSALVEPRPVENPGPMKKSIGRAGATVVSEPVSVRPAKSRRTIKSSSGPRLANTLRSASQPSSKRRRLKASRPPRPVATKLPRRAR